MKAKMDSKNISVVVQGVVQPYLTYECLLSIKKFLPNAKIILSTYEQTPISFLEGLYDILVLNKNINPIADCYIPNNPLSLSKPNNFNNQVLTTKAGLKYADTKYTLKLRSDFILNSSKFIEDYFKIIKMTPLRDNKTKMFEERILTIGTGNQNKMYLCYHLSDLIAFGLTSDVKKLWNIDFIDESFANYCSQNNLIDGKHYFNFRYTCEQQLLLANIKKHNIVCNIPQYYYDINNNIKNDSENILMNNFIFYNYSDSKIFSKFSNMDTRKNLFSYCLDDYFQIYEKNFGKINGSKLDNNSIHFLYTQTGHKTKIGIRGICCYIKTKSLDKTEIKLEMIGIKINFKKFHNKLINKKNKNLSINFLSGYNNFVFIENDVNCIGKSNINIFGCNNFIYIGKNQKIIENCKIEIWGNNNQVLIKKNSHCIKNTYIAMPNNYKNRKIIIGQNSMFMGTNIFCEEDNGFINIGKNLTCSTNTTIHNSDGHVIYDDNNKILNRGSKGVIIGSNVWLGRSSSILKNTNVPNGSIVAYGAIVTKQFNENNIILAGIPAKIIRRNIHYTRKMFNEFSEEGNIAL